MARSAELQGMDLQGRPVLLAVAPVEGTGWMLAIALDKAEALSAIGTMLQVSVLTGLVVLVVAGTVLAGILAQRLRRLTQVRDAMAAVLDTMTLTQFVASEQPDQDLIAGE